ncbi:PepSY-like domain-containing protein [Bacteroides togonis]|uniref:PepSY-like domain-containing protein n=1 Tax=Bacteroides togonis TaxID=1917883 RepID=UPI00094B0212|nr:PepSY-like domain-containing protein [Bacteroides togonis]
MNVRKLLAFFPILLGVWMLSSCDDEKKIDFGDLPSEARSFIENYFPSADILSIVQEKEDGRKEYQVKLSNGTDMEFDEDGEWTNIECYFSPLPTGILPANVITKVEELHPEAYINGVEKELGGYVVEVTDADGIDWDMRFNAQFEYVSQSQDRNDD